MNDVETRIKQLLNENVDQLAGERRPAPAFEPDAVETLPDRRPRWTPLLAAASIVLLVAATVVSVTLLTRGSSTPPVDRSPAPSTTAPSGPTVQKVVRPVTAAGRPAPGWTVLDGTKSPPVTCPIASPAAADPGVAGCGYFGAVGGTCWRAAEANTVLCLIDPLRQRLLRERFSGRFPVAQGFDQPAPLSLTLGDGSRCNVPIGDEFSNLVRYPDLEQRYDCGPVGTLWAKTGEDGLDRSNPVWTVRLFKTARSTGVTRDVRMVYVVGTRR